MIDFDSYKQEPGIPIYLQLENFIKRSIAAGMLKDGEELPSRRWLSARLGINPNTVQKTYSILELQGLIMSKGGSGSVVVLSDEMQKKLRKDVISLELGKTVSAMKDAGLGLEEAISIFKEYWEGRI